MDASAAPGPPPGWHTPEMRAAAALLGSYERQMQSVEGALKVRGRPPVRLLPSHACAEAAFMAGYDGTVSWCVNRKARSYLGL